MRFLPAAVAGVTVVEMDAIEDGRGFFARTFCEDVFREAGITMQVVQANISHNNRAFTLRGMHYQEEPYSEQKIVQCVRGRVWDVAVDLRPSSKTYCRWVAVELSPQSRRLHYIPEGCAHGFITLNDNSDIVYLMGAAHVPSAARGVRWNDPAFGITWPAQPLEVSERDGGYEDYLPLSTTKE